MRASEGGAELLAPGVTTFGTGCQTSVSSGFGALLDPACAAGCCAWRTAHVTSKNATKLEKRIVFMKRSPAPAFKPDDQLGATSISIFGLVPHNYSVPLGGQLRGGSGQGRIDQR